MKFKLIINKKALKDIQNAFGYYENINYDLASRFENSLNQRINTIEINPYFTVRYDTIRCLPLKKFPCMIHFSVNETDQIIKVHALFHRSKDPNIWKNRK